MADNRKVVYMNCPKCGKDVRGLSLVYGKIKITMHKCCNCGREWHLVTLEESVGLSEMVEILERCQKRYAVIPTDPLKKVIWFLISQIDHITLGDGEEAKRKRKADLWERQFLSQANREVY